MKKTAPHLYISLPGADSDRRSLEFDDYATPLAPSCARQVFKHVKTRVMLAAIGLLAGLATLMVLSSSGSTPSLERWWKSSAEYDEICLAGMRGPPKGWATSTSEPPGPVDAAAPLADSPLEEPPEGWLRYQTRASSSSAIAQSVSSLQLTRPQRLFSSDCADLWVSKGKVCGSLKSTLESASQVGDDGAIDVLWTWVNGSDPQLASLRSEASCEPFRRLKKRKMPLGTVARHFRNHDELRYSMRSALQNLAYKAGAVRRFILFTSSIKDEPAAKAGVLGTRLGHVPNWLAMGDQHSGNITVQVRHHWEAFKTSNTWLRRLGYAATEGGALEWRDAELPAFNSLAIESQMVHLEDLPDAFLYLNDDYFLTRPLSSADLTTPLFGAVYRMQSDLHVGSASWESNPSEAMEGEWPSLGYTNLLLSQRFGERSRRYMVHVARVVEVALAREVAHVWSDKMAQTASARLRGRGPEVYAIYMWAWYNIEKHREAALYSFLMLKIDNNLDGVLTPPEQSALLHTLNQASASNTSGDVQDASIHIARPQRDQDVSARLEEVSIETPWETRYTWISADGYPLVSTSGRTGRQWPDFSAGRNREPSRGGLACKIDFLYCFGEGFGGGGKNTSAEAVFKRVAFEKPQCGDCLVTALVRLSGGKGLEWALPPKGPRDLELAEGDLRQGLALEGQAWQDISFKPPEAARWSPRAFAVNALLRYQYALGDSATSFLSIKSIFSTQPLTALADPNNPCAFLAVNDDIRTTRPQLIARIDSALQSFYSSRWGHIKGWWEK